FGDFLNQGSLVNYVPGFSTNSGGVALGADYLFGSDFLVGGSLAYSYSALNIHNGGAGSGFGHTNSGYALFYSSYSIEHFFTDLVLLGAYNGFNGTRHVKFGSSFASLNLKPHHTNSGIEGAVHLAMGVPLGPKGEMCDAWFTPYAMVDYIFIHETDYKEHKGDCIDLKVKSRNSDYLRAEEGFRLSAYKVFTCVTVVPEVRLAVAEEWRFHGKKTTARFQEGDIFFTVNGIFPNRVLFVPGAAVSTYFFNNQSILNVRLDAEIARHYWDVKMQVEYSYRF
ncbi:MAG TPA: autotransporter outer membrane beta-barrel domain-containing protein, partial [Rhabdochlamydiaceae bacterium]|nr:autotransporter outer membrane beta-barrel domain-containing protein [Rhabdochlamydiaceae bacterium]